MAGFRDVVVRWFGEGVARKIEQFVDGQVFREPLVTCQKCGRLVAAELFSLGRCPVCDATATKDTMIEALEARKRDVQEASKAADNEAHDIDRQLSALRRDG